MRGYMLQRNKTKVTLRKAYIVDSVYDYLIEQSHQYEEPFTKEQAFNIVEALIEIIKSTLESGEEVLISGFGKFSVREKAERRGRNPATDEDMILEARRVVIFNASQNLRDLINGG